MLHLTHICCILCIQQLNEVVNAAKEACSEIERTEIADEVVLDSYRRPGTGSLIRQ